MPGPLFNFSAYLGAVAFGLPGALIGLLGLFGPGVILIFAFLPFWESIRKVSWFRAFLEGVNATAIGLVIAACSLLWNGAVDSNADAAVALAVGTMVSMFSVPAPLALVLGGTIGWIMSPSMLNMAQDDICKLKVASYELSNDLVSLLG